MTFRVWKDPTTCLELVFLFGRLGVLENRTLNHTLTSTAARYMDSFVYDLTHQTGPKEHALSTWCRNPLYQSTVNFWLIMKRYTNKSCMSEHNILKCLNYFHNQFKTCQFQFNSIPFSAVKRRVNRLLGKKEWALSNLITWHFLTTRQLLKE